MGVKDAAKVRQLSAKVLMSPWLRHFLVFDPAPALGKVSCPVLAVCGEKNIQVIPELHLPAI